MISRHASVCLLVFAALSRAWCAETAPPPAQPPPEKTAAPAPAGPAAPKTPTVIESGSAEMVSSEKETTFTFRTNVTVTGTNLKITCDHLEVVARRSGDPAATFGKQENFKSLIASGNVRIQQNDREAVCDRAEVFPGDDKVVLTGNPKVRSLDGQYEASGPRMVLHRGERRAEILSEPGERPRITLPPLKDLGYEKEKPKAKKGEADKGAAPEKESAPEKQPEPPGAATPNIVVPNLTPTK